MEHLLIVDGHNLLFQMFYGMPSRIIGRNGTAIQAVVGFIGALLKVIKSIQATCVVVLFDGEKGSYRVDEDINYKGNQKDYTDAPDEDNPFLQLNDIKRVLDFLKIKNFEITERIETDDVIAGYAAKLKDTNKIYILSTDADFMQLVDDNVKVFVYRGKKSVVYDANAVVKKYGITPKYYADYKALVGDTSDNIRGVKGIGPKTAKKLIDKLGHVEEIAANANLIDSESLKSLINDNKDIIFKNIKLIKLSDTTEIPFEIESLHFRNYDNYKTIEILKKIEII